MDWSERIGRRIRLRDLHILLAVVQHKSLALAARQLAISRPVVSKAIADLERVLGVRLLERDRHGAEPTIYGAALLKRGATVFDELREGVKDIGFLADPTAGELRIGCSPVLAASFVPAVVDRLSQRHPNIVFHLVTAYMRELHRELDERNVDLLVTRRFGSVTDEQLSFEPLFDDPYVVAAGAQSPWVRRRKIRLAELVKEPWVMPQPEGPLGSVAMEAFRSSGLDCPPARVFTVSAEARLSLLATGHFLTICSASALRFPTKRTEIKVLPVVLPIPPVPTGIATLKNRMLSPVARLFVNVARELAKPVRIKP